MGWRDWVGRIGGWGFWVVRVGETQYQKHVNSLSNGPDHFP